MDKETFELMERVDLEFPVIERISFAFLLQAGSILRISSVSPEYEKINKISFFVIAPKSPWLASAAFI